MASAGFQIFNNNNVLLINDSYMNFALSRKVKVSTLPYWFADVKDGYMVEGSKFSFRKITLGENENIAFLGGISGKNTLDGFMAIDYYAATLGNSAYYIVLRKGVDASSLYVYVFGEYNKVGGGSERYGLQIFDASKNLVFSSNKKPLKILHHSTSNDGYIIDGNKNVAINVGNVNIGIPWLEVGDPYTPLYIDGHWALEGCTRDYTMPYMSRYFESSAPVIVDGKVKKIRFDNGHPIYGIDSWGPPLYTWNGFIYTIIDVTGY